MFIARNVCEQIDVTVTTGSKMPFLFALKLKGNSNMRESLESKCKVGLALKEDCTKRKNKLQVKLSVGG